MILCIYERSCCLQTYLCTCICVHVLMSVCGFGCMHVSVYMYICMCVCMYVRINVCAYERNYICFVLYA